MKNWMSNPIIINGGNFEEIILTIVQMICPRCAKMYLHCVDKQQDS